MREKVIAVFDIGKTNKKLLLFNAALQVVYQQEEKFPTIVDEDGDECDDMARIENWVKGSVANLIEAGKYELLALNFSTYGASLAFLNEEGERLTPIYNYLKEIPAEIQENLFEAHGGVGEFCRKTASPALGLMLNSGIQMLWLKQAKPEVFAQVKDVLHFPQYLSYLFTNQVGSESTSIGCHTFLWDFDQNTYHPWLAQEGLQLPAPVANHITEPVTVKEHTFACGLGIHDSSASLAPYIQGSKSKFLLVSTGTWCINMNPFNHSPLTAEQLQNDCLCFLSIQQDPVKSSRLFMGHIHDVNTERMNAHFQVEANRYKQVCLDKTLLESYLEQGTEKVFFKNGMPADYIDTEVDYTQFKSFEEAYHRLMYDLTLLNKASIDLVLEPENGVEAIYVSGGFARNEIFVYALAALYPKQQVYTSEIDNASALGAALVVSDVLGKDAGQEIDLGLKLWAYPLALA